MASTASRSSWSEALERMGSLERRLRSPLRVGIAKLSPPMIRRELENDPESCSFPNGQVRSQIQSRIRRRSHLARYILGHRSCLPLPVRG